MKPAQLLIALMFLVLLFAFRDALHEPQAERACEYPIDEGEGGADANL